MICLSFVYSFRLYSATKLLKWNTFPLVKNECLQQLFKWINYLLHLPQFFRYVHSFGTLPFQKETVWLRKLIKWNGSPHIWRQIVWEKNEVERFPSHLTTGCLRKLINCIFFLHGWWRSSRNNYFLPSCFLPLLTLLHKKSMERGKKQTILFYVELAVFCLHLL